MLQVSKEEPNFFRDKKKKVKNAKESSAWKNINDIRTNLREYILNNEQQNMCVYCEKKISPDANKSNIDHFKTRGTHPELTLEYTNLLVSCNNQAHCSNKKDNFGLSKEDFDKLINPVNDDINNSFTHTTFGELVANNVKAEFAIEVFGLNNTALVQERKNILLQLESYTDLEADIILEVLGCHKTLITYSKE